MDFLEKKINFYNDEILTFFEAETKKIYVSIKHICNNLGMNKSQRDHQLHKVRNDGTLKGACKFNPLRTSGGIQHFLMIELDYLPLWLAKINPVRFDAKLKNKLKIYQLQCKDILSEAFFGKRESEEVKYGVELNEIFERATRIKNKKNLIHGFLKEMAIDYTWISQRANTELEKIKYYYKEMNQTHFVLDDKKLSLEDIDRLNEDYTKDILQKV